jgi:hypothetical protein
MFSERAFFFFCGGMFFEIFQIIPYDFATATLPDQTATLPDQTATLPDHVERHFLQRRFFAKKTFLYKNNGAKIYNGGTFYNGKYHI